MRRVPAIAVTIGLCWLTGCASMKSQTTNETLSSTGEASTGAGTGAVFRYLAWFEGDFQTDYQVARDLAESKFKEVDSKAPSPEQTEAYLEYLSLMDASGRHDDAEKRLKAYLVEHPKEKRAVFVLAVHYWRIKKKELASYFFNQLEKEADFPWKSLLYNNLGMMALDDRNRPLALDYFEKAIKANPPTAAALVNLGALYLQSRSYSAAEILFTKARAIDSDFEDAALGLGVSLEGQGKFDEAHRAYSEFMASHGNALSVVYNDAVLLGNRLARKEEAAQLMLRYVQRGGKETAKAQEIIQSWR